MDPQAPRGPRGILQALLDMNALRSAATYGGRLKRSIVNERAQWHYLCPLTGPCAHQRAIDQPSREDTMADRNNNLGNSGRSDDSINNPDLDRDQSGMSGSSRDRSPSDRSSSNLGNLGNQSGLSGSQRDRSQTDEIIGDESTSESGRSGS